MLHAALDTSIEIRIDQARLAEALDWYAQWFELEARAPLPVLRMGRTRIYVVPKWYPRDAAPSILALDVEDAIASATKLAAAGASVRAPILEWGDRFRIELVDPWGAWWRLTQSFREGAERGREILRGFALKLGAGILRLEGSGTIAGLETDLGPSCIDDAHLVLFCKNMAPNTLGLPHFEEYCGLMTTGEPWFYWCFRSPEGHRVALFHSTRVPYGHLWADPADRDLALRLLGFTAEGWWDASPPKGKKFKVMRQDDNGNVFVVDTFDSPWDAEKRAQAMESTGHKQRYWVEETSS